MKKIAKFSAFMVAAMFAATSFTSCGDENSDVTPDPNGELLDKVDFEGLKAIAQADGKIKIVGEISAAKKLKEFEVIDENDNVVATLGDKNTVTKEKEVDENGKKVKKFTMTVTSDPIDVQILKFRIKAGVKKPMVSDAIGEKLSVTIGSSANTTVGSYLSLAENKVYMMSGAKAEPSKIDVIAKSSADKKEVIGIQRATKANSADISANAGKTALFDGAGKKIEDDSYVLAGTIITDGPADACIAKFTVTPNAGSQTAAIEGVIIKNSTLLPLDVTAFTFSK